MLQRLAFGAIVEIRERHTLYVATGRYVGYTLLTIKNDDKFVLDVRLTKDDVDTLISMLQESKSTL